MYSVRYYLTLGDVDMACRKIHVSIPDTVVEDLDYISKRMGITRSALLSNLIAEPTYDLRTLMETVPENPTPQDIMRSRGASASLIKKRLDDFSSIADDLLTPQGKVQ